VVPPPPRRRPHGTSRHRLPHGLRRHPQALTQQRPSHNVPADKQPKPARPAQDVPADKQAPAPTGPQRSGTRTGPRPQRTHNVPAHNRAPGLNTPTTQAEPTELEPTPRPHPDPERFSCRLSFVKASFPP
jgi:hypothetical protein